MSETLQHLVLVRHGESEGDVRRAAWRRGEKFNSSKSPTEEKTTLKGIEECRRAGLWIKENIIARYSIESFDGCYVSSAIRSEQSAIGLDLDEVWQEDHCLDERKRGKVAGLLPENHKQRFPESYAQMKTDPLGWTPPEGESIIDVADRVRQFLENIDNARTAIGVTHRDWLWAAQMPIEHLYEEEMLAVNTDEIHNAQVIHYSSINPESGEQASQLLWKRSVNPMDPTASVEWQQIRDLSLT